MPDRLASTAAVASIALLTIWVLFAVLPCDGNHYAIVDRVMSERETAMTCDRMALHSNIVHGVAIQCAP